MNTFVQPSLYGPMGVAAETQNIILSAAAFVNANRTRLEALMFAPAVTRQWHAVQIVSSINIGANRWEYSVRKVQPDISSTNLAIVTNTEWIDETAYNLAEYGNSAAVAGGGVNATRAATLGFALLPVPIGAFVHSFVMYREDGSSVALFERMNQFDGECSETNLTIDGGTF